MARNSQVKAIAARASSSATNNGSSNTTAQPTRDRVARSERALKKFAGQTSETA